MLPINNNHLKSHLNLLKGAFPDRRAHGNFFAQNSHFFGVTNDILQKIIVIQLRASEYATTFQINSKHLKSHFNVLKAGFQDRSSHGKFFEKPFISREIVTFLESKLIFYKKNL